MFGIKYNLNGNWNSEYIKRFNYVYYLTTVFILFLTAAKYLSKRCMNKLLYRYNYNLL